MITLHGITWDHPRGLDSLVAASAEYHQQHPDIRVNWQPRTLQEFADFPIEKLAETYDLLIIDHPFIGFGAESGTLVPLDDYIEAAILAELDEQSVGASHRSYMWNGHQWALAVDAAAQVAAFRPDLLDEIGAALPETWEDVFQLATLARERGKSIAIPSIPIDAIMSFCSLCANAGEDPLQTDSDVAATKPTATYALETLRRLIDVAHPESINWNPIHTLDHMSSTDDVVYVPLLFGYSNYARPGYADHTVHFTNIVNGGKGGILGGTGIAVSPTCEHKQAAADFAAWVCGAPVQSGVYFEAGGQPGNRVAWGDDSVNAACNNYFKNTLFNLDNAYLRPRYNGMMELQERAGDAIHAFLHHGEPSIDALIEELDRIHRETRGIQ